MPGRGAPNSVPLLVSVWANWELPLNYRTEEPYRVQSVSFKPQEPDFVVVDGRATGPGRYGSSVL
jgi:hypothetical protein